MLLLLLLTLLLSAVLLLSTEFLTVVESERFVGRLCALDDDVECVVDEGSKRAVGWEEEEEEDGISVGEEAEEDD